MFGRLAKDRVELLVVFFSVVGLVLVVLGAVVEMPYTVKETFNNYPYNPVSLWANETITLRPGDSRIYNLDIINMNNSIIYVLVERTTSPIIMEIDGPSGVGFYNVSERTINRQHIWYASPVNPFEFYWTPTYNTGWDFVFYNPFDVTANVTLTILDYRYNVEWQRNVTHYSPPLDRTFAYGGIILVAIAVIPTAYDLYKTRKEKQKKAFWQGEAYAQKMREQEEKGKLK
ncbi:MAG: hypothetical protein OEY22_01000 [Candidatus Bathyarchaeota archaeon]|nr:hypothetical protein [Candidatus Bathyarchaeota archaeon]MDH5787434.1 hypothetical protein [Candidatus Bathyarchaeota archaeon]